MDASRQLSDDSGKTHFAACDWREEVVSYSSVASRALEHLLSEHCPQDLCVRREVDEDSKHRVFDLFST